MKLNETQRLQLENLHLKKILLEKEVNEIQLRYADIQSKWDGVLKEFLKEEGKEIELNKLSINLATGEVKEKSDERTG